MKRVAASVLAILLSLIMAVGCLPAGAVFLGGSSVADFTVTFAETHQLGEGLVYNQFNFKDSSGVEQTCFTMEFNPTTSDFRSYVYHAQASHGYTIVDDVESARKEGLDVYAAINGDFFSMESANYGTPIGIYGTAGRLTVASVGHSGYNLVIDEDGRADVIKSKLVYGLTIGGTNYNTKLTAVNKRATNYDTNYVYYFDRNIGSITPTSASLARTELICTVTEGALTVGGTLKGTVSSINATGGSVIGSDQFVLSGGTDFASATVGTEVVITLAESVEDSKEAMENASHFISCHQVMKVDGYDRWASGDLVNPGLSEQFAQRSVVGIKADGTMIYLVCDGRKTTEAGTNGFDYDMLMEVMSAYDCTDIINFDGGGSTAVVLGERDGKESYEFIGAGTGTGRTVANSILIVRDPKADPLPEESYEPIVDKPGTELRNVAINKSYSIVQYGASEPTYLSTVQGDPTGRKLTNGKYRTPENASDALTLACMGTKIQLHVAMNLEKARDDIRSIVWRGVSTVNSNSFRTDNVIVYVSDDGENWGPSIAGEVMKKETDIDGVCDIAYIFKEAQSGQYVKLVFGNSSSAIAFDEIEVNAMVDENEPVEEPLPEDETNLPAEQPSETCVNVALGKSYTLTSNGTVPYNFYETTKDPRYYSATTAESSPQKLTDGKLGTEGSFNDGCTLGIRSGTSAAIEIIIDLGEVVEEIEFVQLLQMIDNAGSFGKLSSADVSYSVDGTEYTLGSFRINTEAVQNTHYHNLTLQSNRLITARYIKVSFLTPKFLFAVGEITVYTAAEEVVEDPILYGDVNGDGKVTSLDAAQILKHDAMMITIEGDSLVAADVTGDGKVNSLDAAQILKYDAFMIDKFPVEANA